MVKCKVCMTEYPEKNNYECPFCGFDQPYTLGQSDDEIRAYIDNEKLDLLKKLRIGTETFLYDILDSSVVEAGTEIIPFPQISEFDKVYTSNQKTEPIPTRDTVSISVIVSLKNNTFRIVSDVRNIKDAKCLFTGVAVDKDFNITVELSDENGKTEKSEKIYMFRNRS
ncbi:MAG: hypothetical protein II059_05415 [Clostridia bacterium]|nr:hypothetical protein [Clostridia bacterium]